MGSDDELARPSPVTYARSRRPDDEETVPDSEDSTSRAEPRPAEDDLPKQPIKGHGDESEPPRPPRAVYRSHKRALSPPSLSYTSLTSTEEVIPDSEENGRGVGSSDDEESDDIPTSNVPRTTSSGLSDWKQKLRDIDTEYDMDDSPSGPHHILSPASNSKATSSEDPFGSPLTTHASSQLASHRSPTDALLSSPPLNASSSTNTTPQFVFGTPQAPSPTPPTSDGKPSPIPKTKTKGKAKGKARALSEVQEASIDDQLVPSPGGVRQTRRKEKQKKTKAPTKKELLETRRETARMRSDVRVSISTEATRPLGVEGLLERFREPEARPLQPHSSIEAWSSSSPSSSASRHDHGGPEEAHQDRNAQPSHQQPKSSRRSVSPFHSNGLLAPASKYKTVTFAAIDDPFLATTPTTKPETDRDAGSDSDSDAEMPGIGVIFAQRQAREDQRTKQEQLHQRKLAALEQQKNTPDTDDSDDGLDVVADTMHSVAREEAAARAAAGKPSAGRNAQLRFAGVVPSPQRPALLPTESPEKRMAVAARPAFLASFARGNGAAGAAAGRGKRGANMTKAELDQMMLRSADAQSKLLRGSKEEEWVRRGGRVTGIMQDVGSENLQTLMEEALERDGGADMEDGGDDDDDDEEDGDYVPVERGSASPRPMKAQGEAHDDQKAAADEEIMHEDEQHRVADDRATEVAVDTDSEIESSAADDVRLRRPRGARPRHAVIGSDDEGTESGAENAAEEDVHPPPLSLPDLPSPAFASPWPSRHPGPDHGDEKENDPDVSGNDTDKENRAVVVCRMPPSSAPVQGARVLFDDLLGARAAAQPMPLLGDDDPFVFTPSPVKARDSAPCRMESPTPVRVFGTSGKRGLSQMFEEEDSAPMPQGCNDNSAARGDVDPGFVEFKSALGGLSQAFEQTQDVPGSVAGAGGFAALRRGADAELSLTFDAQAAALQPALEVDDRLRAQAAAIFEKEQEYVIQAAQPAPSRPRSELYITENGFLTQTRPEGNSSPLVYRPSPSQRRPYDALLRTQSEGALGTAASSPLAARQPLSTLAETSPQSSVGREPLRRLRRAQTSPEAPVTGSGRRYAYPREQSLSPSPSPSHAKTKGGAAPPAPAMMMQGRTAFSELMLGAKSAVHRDGERAKAKKRSEFVEDQAVESDEDDMLGFGGVRKKNGDEEEDENDEHDAEGVLKDLVDDAQMDDSAIAKSKVLEKHLEQQNEDDERLEKEMHDVVVGKRRTRRRRGGAGGLLGSDASDDESSDDEARALRQHLAKKRRVEGDTLDALARDPATAAFHATYHNGLVDNADEFAHLDRDGDEDGDDNGAQENQDRGEGEEGDGGDGGRGRDADADEDEDEDVEMAPPSIADNKEISATEVRKALQEMARGKREHHAHDPEDVSWVDQDADGADEAATTLQTRVRMASSSAPYKAPPPAQSIPADADMDVIALRRIHAEEQNDPAYNQRMNRWLKDEGASSHHHRSGTGNAAGAVTGHRSRGAAAAAARSTRQPPAKRTTGAAATSGPVRRTASALSAVANRSARFGG